MEVSLSMSHAVETAADLSPEEKRALLQRLLEKKASASSSFPSSFAQQRLWFLHQVQPASCAYNLSRAIRIRGGLDLRTFQKALEALVARHECLRTTFAPEDDEPVQVVSPPGTLEMPVVELSGLSTTEREAETLRLATEEIQRPFDLAHGPLLRTTLLRLSESDHVFVLTMHHIVSDGWSIDLFFRELAALYEGISAEHAPTLRPLSIQYADFARWQRQAISGEILSRELGYWRQQLGGELPVLELPTDRPRPAVQRPRGARLPIALSGRLTESLRALSRREGITLFMTLLSGFKCLLHRYTGQHDIVVGSPVAGRNQEQTEDVIGPFINNLVLRTDMSGDPTFRELLRRVQQVAVGAYAHQNVPFEKVVEEIQPNRDLSHSPLFQVMFVLQKTARQPLELPGLDLNLLEVDGDTAMFDLTPFLWEERDGLSGTLEYNTDLFDEATVGRMAKHLRTLLEGVVANPDQRLSELPLLSEAEERRLLVEWNETRAEYRRDSCLHQLFEDRVRCCPDAVAVVFEGQQVTYEELNRRANRLAHHLQRLGVGPRVMVGIYVERSLEMLIGLLGILKAGGTYVPLDPAFPAERLAFMLDDSQVPVVLTLERLVESVPRFTGAALCLDRDWELVEHESDANPNGGAAPNDPAYVIYTSGSTGKPKGVQIQHRAAVNLLESMAREPGLEERDTMLAVTTLSFDIALLELFLPLIVGARLVVVRRETASDGKQLQEKLKDSGATVMQATPATWRLLLESSWPGDTSLKVLCGGEALSGDLATQLRDRCASLWNLYGPTEATIWSTLHRVDDVDAGNGFVPIGRPIANTQLYVLDAYQQPVPVGVAGELHIGGDGLALGYYQRPELTAEKFIEHPFSKEPGARLYRTGDLARYLPDGKVAFLGRLDHQVKVRGFRIELGEIEAALRQHPAVRESAVMAREDAPGDKRLVAYVVGRDGSVPAVGELRNFLKERLPDYMLPSAFVVLEALPLTPNGKVDRRAVPAPDAGGREMATFVAPRTPLESQLATVWEKVLGHVPIGVRDDFFEIGGHSLLAVRLFRQIEEVTGKTLSVATIFEAPTIEGMAEILQGNHDAGSSPRWPVLVPLQASGFRPPFFLVAGIEHHFGDLLGPDQPVYRVQAQDLDREQLFTSVEEMAANCLENIRALQPEGPYFLGGYCFGGVVAFEIAQQLDRQGQKVALLAMLDAYVPGSMRIREDIGLPYQIWMRVEFYWKRMRTLGSSELIGKLLRDARKTSREAMWRMSCWLGSKLRVARILRDPRAANYRARRQYVPQVYPGRLTVFPCTERAPWRQVDAQNGWGDLATDGVEVHRMPGHHSGITKPPVVHQLVETLDDCLRRARGETDSEQERAVA
jgi:aspartate racemase